MSGFGADARYMEAAFQQARKSYAEGGLPIGAVMVRDQEVIGAGHNRRVQDGDPTAHGEISCIRDAGRRTNYDGITLYTTLSPCMMCSGTIVQFGIRRVVIGESINFAGNIRFLRDQGIDVKVLNDDRCIDLLGRFIRENPELWDEDIAARDRASARTREGQTVLSGTRDAIRRFWLFAQLPGRDELKAHVKSLQAMTGAQDHSAVFEHLYGTLSILDSKCSSLLTFNSIIIAVFAIFLTSAPVPAQWPFLIMGVVAVVASCFLLLSVLWVHWSTTDHLDDPGRHARVLLGVRRTRTIIYRVAWYLAVISILGLSAFMALEISSEMAGPRDATGPAIPDSVVTGIVPTAPTRW